ncbi:hypothetical protein [Promicromonospora sp. NPDC019610]|uniref:hypothetical protein n=1 Tax=Promicromonospora sp. NPDC019610 TaxID=3364405 RepID=UPI0037A5021C
MTETLEYLDDEQIVQLIPADGWVAVYRDEEAEVRAPLVAWGLRRDGEVVPLDTDPSGTVGDPRETAGFDRVERVGR